MTTDQPTTAGIDVWSLYLGCSGVEVRIRARAGEYGPLVRGKGGRKIDLSVYEQISGAPINYTRLEACEKLHAIDLEQIRLQTLSDFCDQRMGEINERVAKRIARRAMGPKSVLAAAALAANPHRTDLAIAAEIGVCNQTVARERKRLKEIAAQNRIAHPRRGHPIPKVPPSDPAK